MEGVDWIYLLSEREGYPDPKDEMVALYQLEKSGQEIAIMLTDREDPPISGGSENESIAFCIRGDMGLVVLATGKIASGRVLKDTPEKLIQLYKKQPKQRWFLPMKEVTLNIGAPMEDSILSIEDQKRFLSGQAYVKRLSKRPPSQAKTE